MKSTPECTARARVHLYTLHKLEKSNDTRNMIVKRNGRNHTYCTKENRKKYIDKTITAPTTNTVYSSGNVGKSIIMERKGEKKSEQMKIEPIICVFMYSKYVCMKLRSIAYAARNLY